MMLRPHPVAAFVVVLGLARTASADGTSGAMFGVGGVLGVNAHYDSSVTKNVPEEASSPMFLGLTLAGSAQLGAGPFVAYASGTAVPAGTIGTAWGGRVSALIGPHDTCSTAATMETY